MNHQQASLLTCTEVATALETCLSSGLSSTEAELRLKRYGLNRFDRWLESECSKRNNQNFSGRFLDHFCGFLKLLFSSPLNQLFLLCALIQALVLGSCTNAATILASPVLISFIVHFQQWRSGASLSELAKQMRLRQSVGLAKCLVIRDGRSREISPDILVPGDLVLVDALEHRHIHADLRLVEVRGGGNESNEQIYDAGRRASAATKRVKLWSKIPSSSSSTSNAKTEPIFAVDETNLTGETGAQAKTVTPIQRELTQLLLQNGVGGYYSIAGNDESASDELAAHLRESLHQNIALAGTCVKRGRARGLVIATGTTSRLGQVFGVLRASNGVPTKLTDNRPTLLESIERFCHSSVVLFLLIATALSVGAIVVGLEVSKIMHFALAFVVVSMPEGLPACLQMVQARGVSRLVAARLIARPSRSGASLDMLGRLHIVLLAVGIDSPPPLQGCNQGLVNGRRVLAESVAQIRDQFNIDVKLLSGESRATALAQAKHLGLVSGSCGSGGSAAETPLYHTIGAAAPSTGAGIAFSSSLSSLRLGNFEWNFEDSILEPDDSDDESRLVMSGAQLQRLLNSDLDQLAKAREVCSRTVFFSVDAQQKANIVRKLQDLGRLVCVIGESVNDIACLQRADLSLVPCAAGAAEACEEVADLIALAPAGEERASPGDSANVPTPARLDPGELLDQLLEAIVEGRGVYTKLRSFIAHQTAISLTVALLTSIVLSTGAEFPMSGLQLLLINLLADVLPAQALALESLSESEAASLTSDLPPAAKGQRADRGASTESTAPPSASLTNCWLVGTVIMLTLNLVAICWATYTFVSNTDDDEDDGDEADTADRRGAGSLTSAADADERLRVLVFSCLVFCSLFTALGLRSRTKTTFETRPHGNWPLTVCCLAFCIMPFLESWIAAEAQVVRPLELVYVLLVASLALLLTDTAKLAYRLIAHTRKLMLKAAQKLHDTSGTSSDISAGASTCPLKATHFGRPTRIEVLGGRFSGGPFSPALPQVIAPSPATMLQTPCMASSSPRKTSAGSKRDELKERLSKNF